MKAASIIKTLLLIIIAVTGWYGLVLQLYLMVQTAMEKDLSLASELLRYFSYFTILTNLLVAVCVTTILFIPRSRAGCYFSNPSVQAGVAIYILVVGITYSVALRHIWNPTGLQYVADRVLHDVIPVLFILYWGFFVPKDSFKWSHPLWWLLYPLVYLVYVMTRGALMHVYPYYFLDPNESQWSGVGISILVLFAAFAVLGFLTVGISRLFYRAGRS